MQLAVEERSNGGTSNFVVASFIHNLVEISDNCCLNSSFSLSFESPEFTPVNQDNGKFYFAGCYLCFILYLFDQQRLPFSCVHLP